MKDIAFAAASRLAVLIRNREIGCLELLDYFYRSRRAAKRKIERSGRIRDYDRVRSQARALDSTTSTGALHGVPMTIKEGIELPDYQQALVFQTSPATSRKSIVLPWHGSSRQV